VILVTGGTGQLGTAFRALVPEAAFPGRDILDLAAPDRIGGVLSDLAPEAIINCAAYTAVDRAEGEEETATMVNAVAVEAMARYAAARDIPFVTFSTDYVFDGTATEPYVESSPPSPINAYGRSKLAGEVAARSAHAGALVVRTSWVFSATHRNFVFSILDLAATRPVDVVADQTGCPSYAPDLAAATLEAVERGVSGVLHLTNAGATTWFELARTACGAAGLDPGLIRPITTEQYPTPARRPKNSSLGSERLAGLGLSALRPWRDAVREAVDRRVHPA
jgi:dTDP-4-dehydrorhamnose reductase